MPTTLKKINGNDIAKIASGQVIIDLKSVVKELIENALDAKATNIDIKLSNYGADLIEVSDNGLGIQKDDFAGIAMKYYTSKIHEFDDIRSIDSFGFRGEALSCICELSGEFSIVTRHVSDDCGTFIQYNPDGSILEEHPQARTVGTTVTVKNLFAYLPVRQKAYLRSCKIHLSNMITLLQSYAVSCLGVRLCVTHYIPSTGKTLTLLSIPANLTTKQRVQAIYGTKVCAGLSEFNATFHIPQKSSMDEDIQESSVSSLSSQSINDSVYGIDYELEPTCIWNTELKEDNTNIHGYFTGFISRIGSSFNASDRGNVNLSSKGNQSKQLLFVNNRFIEYKKLIDCFNQIWRDFEPRTLPVFVLNIILPPSYYDINLSIDKKQILFMNEGLIFRALQEILRCVIDTSNMNMKIYSIHSQKEIVDENAIIKQQKEERKAIEREERKEKEREEAEALRIKEDHIRSVDKELEELFAPSQVQEIPSSISQVEPSSLSTLSLDVLPSNQLANNPSQFLSIEEEAAKEESLKINEKLIDLSLDKDDEDMIIPELIRIPDNSSNNPLDNSITNLSVDSSNISSNNLSTSSNNHTNIPSTSSSNNHSNIPSTSSSNTSSDFAKPFHSVTVEEIPLAPPSTTISHDIPLVVDRCKKSKKKRDLIQTTIESYQSKRPEVQDKPINRPISSTRCILSTITMDSILSQFQTLSSSSSFLSMGQSDFLETSNQENEPEEQLVRILKKDSFKDMEVIGQFNNSFIICRYNNDLFIFDQHACDEKYNYETMMNENKIQSQSLIKPIQLQLTPDQEFVIVHNVNVFTRSGFEISLNEEGQIGSRIQLTSLPASKQYTFNVDDFMELLSVVMESGGNVKRTPKLAKILAMRACHKSVRAGDPLTYAKMVSIVRSLATLERPWSCPHGRPTLRHLVTLVPSFHVCFHILIFISIFDF